MYRILSTADWHLRSTVPSCVDATPNEWMQIQRDALGKLLTIAIENKVSAIYCGGDIYHSDETTSFECIQLVQDFGKDAEDEGIDFFIFAGNHDLPYHSSKNIYKSAIGVTFKSKYIKHMSDDCSRIKGCNFDIESFGNSPNIFKHILCIPFNEIPPHVVCETPESLLSKYPSAKRIFTGDYHKNFYYEKDGRIVINSGCLTRQAIDFEDYITGCYIVDLEGIPEDDFWVPINIPQKFNHNGEVKKELDESVEQFVTGIKKESISLDFISSVKKEILNHDKDVQDTVKNWIKEIGQ